MIGPAPHISYCCMKQNYLGKKYTSKTTGTCFIRGPPLLVRVVHYIWNKCLWIKRSSVYKYMKWYITRCWAIGGPLCTYTLRNQHCLPIVCWFCFTYLFGHKLNLQGHTNSWSVRVKWNFIIFLEISFILGTWASLFWDQKCLVLKIKSIRSFIEPVNGENLYFNVSFIRSYLYFYCTPFIQNVLVFVIYEFPAG